MASATLGSLCKITAEVTGPFQRVQGIQDQLVDTRFGVRINLLPGGGVLLPGCKVPFPEPVEVSDQPRLVSLPDLISLKLDSHRVSPLRRAKDLADVTELLQRRKLSRDFPVAAVVRQIYVETWDGLKAEGW